MRRIFSFSLFLLLTAVCYAQTTDETPIYKRSAQRLTIRESGVGGVHFLYQNPEYTQIVDIVSFTLSDKDKAVNLLNECLKILEMPKTGEDNHIRHEAERVGIVRYGFSQDIVHLHEGLKLTADDCRELIEAIEGYSFSTWQPAFNVGDSVIYEKLRQKYVAVITDVTEGSNFYGIRYTGFGGVEESKKVPLMMLKPKD